MVRFGLSVASALILGGWLFAIPLYDCNLRQNRHKTKNTRPPPPRTKKNSRMAKLRVLASAKREKRGGCSRMSKEMEASIFVTFHPLPYCVSCASTVGYNLGQN